MSLANRMLAHTIDHCTASAGYRKPRGSKAGTIALWVCVAALVVAYVVFK
jgi:hypothetical protein